MSLKEFVIYSYFSANVCWLLL